MEKGVITVITAIFITARTLLAATAETVIMPGKGAITVIVVISVTAGTPLVAMAETAAIPGIRLNQIGLLKDAGNTLGFKVRFYNDIIVIKKSNDIDITALNDKAAISRVITLETSQSINQILEYKEIIHL